MSTQIRRAILSVSDKSGIVEFARELEALGVELVSTGGTMKILKENGLKVKSVTEVTGFPEIMDGRVKTLHPAVFSGILARRDNEQDLKTLEEKDLLLFDMIVVNLYPFEKVSSRPDAPFDEVIENIDIGGPSMLRAAAKNFKDVAVVSSPDQYDDVIVEMKENKKLSGEKRMELALQVFKHTSEYDYLIASYLDKQKQGSKKEETGFPQVLNLGLEKMLDLRYGENPHQKAACYRIPGESETSIPGCRLLHGKPLSFNNIADLDTALDSVRDFEETAAVILKHANPCGLAVADSQAEAYKLAMECDPVSAFGGIVGLNRPVSKETAEQIRSTFIECVVAPSFTQEALEILTKKKNIRLLEAGEFTPKKAGHVIKSVVGGALIQSRDLGEIGPADLKVASKTQPTEEDVQALLFAWKVVKWVKSNSIVYTGKNYTLGIGAGQMSRVDASELGVKKARKSLKGAYMASDAFFPFRDNIDAAAEAGIRAVIEPGGSKRDPEVIEAADEHGLILVFTGMRHFRH